MAEAECAGSAPQALQLCPNDLPPFADICNGHAAALAKLGYRVRTVFFERRMDGDGDAEAVAADALDEAPFNLLVTHRYRAYRAGVRLARGRSALHIAIAHEFGLFARYRRRLRQRLTDRSRTRFAGVSPAVADDLRASGIKDPAVLPNPIDAPALRRDLLPRSAARRALGLPQAAFAIGVVGRLHPKKAPQEALDAFRAFARTEKSARLVFLGDGPLRGQLERAAGAQVAFAGFRADARRLLGGFDVLLSCATAREAFGLVLLEAMAAGVPVVCADRPGPRFVLGDCGYYFDTQDALLAAVRRVRRGARQATPEQMAQRAEAAFSSAALATRYRALLRDG